MVEIYGAEWCAYCKNAVKLCEEKQVQYSYIDIDDSANFRQLEERVGMRVKQVPQVFIDGTYVSGGFSGLQQALA